jgi:UDP-N-acetylmuramoyl-L-alanyl-D-glutamate--2,6-diaminopimelate ligase
MNIHSLIKDLPNCQLHGENQSLIITGISSNSQTIQPGNLFIAKKGETYDGKKFLAEAIQKGAIAVVSESFDPSLNQICQIVHSSPGTIDSRLASTFYQNPSQELFMVGITGTNGKTTTSFILKNLLDHLLGLTGVIGTIEYVIGKDRYPSTRTTPDVVMNHRMLREMCEKGSKAAVMEVSSHALEQSRVDQIDFDVAVFTNLTTEHLDYHGSMQNYARAKKKLFDSLQTNGTAIVNHDSPWTNFLTQDCTSKVLSYGCNDRAALRMVECELFAKGTQATIEYEEKKHSVFFPMLGRFNVYNCLAAMAVALSQNISIVTIIEAFQYVEPVRGRLQPVPNAQGLQIFVDFAHTDDALVHVLAAIKEVKKETGQIILVFGCGGDRDRTKREKMGEAGEKYADMCILTSDNPRSEDPYTICQEVAQGFADSSKMQIEVDRYKAIEKAIQIASSNDVILIAGKGHESMQIGKDRSIPFDDYRVASEICANKVEKKCII